MTDMLTTPCSESEESPRGFDVENRVPSSCEQEEGAVIYFDRSTNTFILRGAAITYCIHITSEGQLVHAGMGTAKHAHSSVATHSLSVDSEVSIYERDCPRPEIPTHGDCTFGEVALRYRRVHGAADVPPHPGLIAQDLRLRYVGHEITNARPALAPPRSDKPREQAPSRNTLEVRLYDEVAGLSVTVCYRVLPDTGIIERWYEISNISSSPIWLEQCFWGVLQLDASRYQLRYVSGDWASEFQEQTVTLPTGRLVLENRAIQTGHHFNPFFLIGREGQVGEFSGPVVFGALAFSGDWSLTFEQRPGGLVTVFGGYGSRDSAVLLQPRGAHATPAFAFGCTTAGWGGASQQLHSYVHREILPRSPREGSPAPVSFNSWEAAGFDLTESRMIQLADQAAQLGIELFCMDDGWFGSRRSPASGLGDWKASPDLFPKGLDHLIGHVHARGMRFGLWVEPEMVNPDSDLYRAHPDWVLHYEKRPRTEMRNQLVLDLGRPEVVDHVLKVFDGLLCAYSIDMLKWDMNRYATEWGSVAGGELGWRHTMAVYAIIDELRIRHPNLTIEASSAGGGRIDLGMFQRVERSTVSDNIDPLDRVKIQQGMSLAYPACLMNNWVTETFNRISGRTLPRACGFDVAMRGVLSVSTDLLRLTDEEKALYHEYIVFYKRVRPVIQAGAMCRLERWQERGLSALQYTAEDGKLAVLSLVVVETMPGCFMPRLRLRSLRPDLRYTATDFKGTHFFSAAGAELMELGVPPLIGSRRYPGGWSLTLLLSPSTEE